MLRKKNPEQAASEFLDGMPSKTVFIFGAVSGVLVTLGLLAVIGS